MQYFIAITNENSWSERVYACLRNTDCDLLNCPKSSTAEFDFDLTTKI